MEGSSNYDLSCDGESVLLKSGLEPLNMNLALSFDGDDSSMTSVIEGYESPLSSWDSEPETDILSVINCHGMHEGPLEGINLEESYLAMEQESQFVGVENTDDNLSWEMDSTDDNLSWEMDNRSYDELLKKFNKNEEELRVSNLKLQISEQDIIKLKVQVENSEGQLDNVREELKLKEEEMNKQKVLSEEKNFKLKNEVEKKENQLGNVRENLKLKEEELQKQIVKLDTHIHVVNEQLKISKDEIASLRKELDGKSSQTHQLQGQLKVAQNHLVKSECQIVSGRKEIQILEEMITMYESVNTNHELWLQKVNSMLDSLDKSSLEKDELINKLFCKISEMKLQLISKLDDCESRNSELEDKVMQYETEKMKQEELNATQQMVLQVQINSLREELGQRKDDVEAANNELDKLMNERDEDNAKIDKLQAEICSHNDQISNMKRYILELKERMNELVVDYKTTLNEENKLKLRVRELEKEVTRKNGVISNKDEEKREAIRQLCFTLEYFRSRYLELLQTFVSHRRRGGVF